VAAAVVLAAAGPAACSDGGAADRGAEGGRTGDDAAAGATAAASSPRLDEIQVVASHNSYHLQPEPALFEAMLAVAPDLVRTLEYSHPPLDEQLDAGVRGIELDVFADPDGGLFARRSGPALLGLPSAQGPPELDEPGFKVLHVQDIDFGTTCTTLVTCLSVVRDWSDRNPGHVPIVIQVEPKADAPELPIELARPVPYTPDLLRDLDAEIRSVFGPRRLITPDDVRRGERTVAAGLRRHGWPAVDDVRGRVLVALDSGGAPRDHLLSAFPGLRGSSMFDSAEPGTPTAAYAVENDPIDAAAIRRALDAGMLVRTRADADLVEARRGDTATRDAALGSGAQVVTTDFFRPVPEVGGDYVVTLPGGGPVRCNPVTAPPACRTPSGG
jgi:hypothetical protein